jgi:Poly(ADP-ribose) polymerase catalytic domain
MASLASNTSASADDKRNNDIKGCFVSKEYAELPAKGSIDAIVSYFNSECKSPEFCVLWENAGFKDPSFHHNPHLRAGNPGRDKFASALPNLEHSACLGIAFHGTVTTNIASILVAGLDPSRRRGQAYGAGEYFSKDPAVSIGYCKSGLEMLVFVVVLPSTLTPRNSSPASVSQSEKSVPHEFLVIDNNSHQLPIGTMKFRSVNPDVLNASQENRRKFLELSKQVFDRCRIAEEGRIKALIMKYLIFGTVDLASELYVKQGSFLKESSKKEISWYVFKTCENDLIDYFFPNLPDPMSPLELSEAHVKSVDDAIQDVTEAIRQLEVARQGGIA